MWLVEVSDLPSYFSFGGIVGSCMGLLLQPPRVKTLATPTAPIMSSLSASCSIFASRVLGAKPFLNLCVSMQWITLPILFAGKLTSWRIFCAIFAPSFAWSLMMPSSSWALAMSCNRTAAFTVSRSAFSSWAMRIARL